jgi:hypothetical protein
MNKSGLFLVVPLVTAINIQAQAVSKNILAHLTWGSGQMELGGPKSVGADAFSEKLGPQCMGAGKNYLVVADRANDRLIAIDFGGKYLSSTKTFGSVCPIVIGNQNESFVMNRRAIDIYNDSLAPISHITFQVPPGVAYFRYMAFDANSDSAILFSKNGTLLLKKENPTGNWTTSVYPFGPLSEIERGKKKVIVGVKTAGNSHLFSFEITPPVVAWRAIEFAATDKKGNYYFKAIKALGPGTNDETMAVIRKYTSDGQVVGEIQLDYDDDLFYEQESVFALNSEGSLFQLNIKKEGPILIKWEFE